MKTFFRENKLMLAWAGILLYAAVAIVRIFWRPLVLEGYETILGILIWLIFIWSISVIVKDTSDKKSKWFSAYWGLLGVFMLAWIIYSIYNGNPQADSQIGIFFLLLFGGPVVLYKILPRSSDGKGPNPYVMSIGTTVMVFLAILFMILSTKYDWF